MAQGVAPRSGPLVSQFYGSPEEDAAASSAEDADDYEAEPVATVPFGSSRSSRAACASCAGGWQHDPSETEGQDFQAAPPYQVAPSDSYRRQEFVPDRVFVGNGLIRRLRQNNLLGQFTAPGANDEWINRASVPVAAPHEMIGPTPEEGYGQTTVTVAEILQMFS